MIETYDPSFGSLVGSLGGVLHVSPHFVEMHSSVGSFCVSRVTMVKRRGLVSSPALINGNRRAREDMDLTGAAKRIGTSLIDAACYLDNQSSTSHVESWPQLTSPGGDTVASSMGRLAEDDVDTDVRRRGVGSHLRMIHRPLELLHDWAGRGHSGESEGQELHD